MESGHFEEKGEPFYITPEQGSNSPNVGKEIPQSEIETIIRNSGVPENMQESIRGLIKTISGELGEGNIRGAISIFRAFKLGLKMQQSEYKPWHIILIYKLTHVILCAKMDYSGKEAANKTRVILERIRAEVDRIQQILNEMSEK